MVLVALTFLGLSWGWNAVAQEKSPAAAPKITLKAKDRVFFVGDSTTAGGTRPFGFVTLVQQAFDEQRPEDMLKASSRGYWAASSNSLTKAVDFVGTLKEKPTHAVIYFGLNDSRFGKDAKNLENYANNLRLAVEGFRAAGTESIICTPTVWRTMQQAAPHAEVARKTAAELNVPLLDLWAAFDRYLRSVGKFKEDEFAHLNGMPTTLDPTCDGVHHGSIGNRIIAEEFLKLAGLKPQWEKYPVTVSLGNVGRNIGYGPRGKGTIRVEPKKDLYQKGDTITLSVKPDEGQMFYGWRGNIESTEPTVTFTVDGPAFIEAIVEAPKPRK